MHFWCILYAFYMISSLPSVHTVYQPNVSIVMLLNVMYQHYHCTCSWRIETDWCYALARFLVSMLFGVTPANPSKFSHCKRFSIRIPFLFQYRSIIQLYVQMKCVSGTSRSSREWEDRTGIIILSEARLYVWDPSEIFRGGGDWRWGSIPELWWTCSLWYWVWACMVSGLKFRRCAAIKRGGALRPCCPLTRNPGYAPVWLLYSVPKHRGLRDTVKHRYLMYYLPKFSNLIAHMHAVMHARTDHPTSS